MVCGLPGSGKTTRAKLLEAGLRAIRFSPDEWMGALSLDIYDEGKRETIEALQWKFAQRLLTLGVTVIIEWGTWARSERDTLRTELAPLALPSSCTTFRRQWIFFSKGFNGEERKIRPLNERHYCDGPKSSKRPLPRKWHSSTNKQLITGHSYHKR